MGYELDRIVCGAPNEVICILCDKVAEVPVQSPDGYVYCGNCIREAFVVHNDQANSWWMVDGKELGIDDFRTAARAIRQLILGLTITCRFLNRGCRVVTRVGEEAEHALHCQHRTVNITHLMERTNRLWQEELVGTVAVLDDKCVHDSLKISKLREFVALIAEKNEDWDEAISIVKSELLMSFSELKHSLNEQLKCLEKICRQHELVLRNRKNQDNFARLEPRTRRLFRERFTLLGNDVERFELGINTPSVPTQSDVVYTTKLVEVVTVPNLTFWNSVITLPSNVQSQLIRKPTENETNKGPLYTKAPLLGPQIRANNMTRNVLASPGAAFASRILSWPAEPVTSPLAPYFGFCPPKSTVEHETIVAGLENISPGLKEILLLLDYSSFFKKNKYKTKYEKICKGVVVLLPCLKNGSKVLMTGNDLCSALIVSVLLGRGGVVCFLLKNLCQMKTQLQRFEKIERMKRFFGFEELVISKRFNYSTFDAFYGPENDFKDFDLIATDSLQCKDGIALKALKTSLKFDGILLVNGKPADVKGF